MQVKMQNIISEIDQLRIENEGLKELNKNLISQIEILKSEIEKYAGMLRELQRAQYGKKSERWESQEQTLMVFNEAEVEALKAEPDETQDATEDSSEVKVEGYTKKRGHRKPLPPHLEREIVKIELLPEKRFSQEGLPLKEIGYEVSEKLVYQPSKLSIKEIHRVKYGVDAGDYDQTAPYPCILPKSMASESLIAGLITHKYADSLPLYRMEEIFSRQGVDLPRCTQARWLIEVSKKLQPILNILSDRLIESFYISADETRFQVLKEKNREAESQSWMWVRSTPYGENKIVIFEYDPSRSQEVAKRIFQDYKGYFQCDGYAAYNILEKAEEIYRLGCSMHARRYFEKAFTLGSKSGQSLADRGLDIFKNLFKIEDEIRDQVPEERKKIRLEKSLPLWNSIKEFTDLNQPKVPPESLIGKAFTYIKNEYKYLIKYLDDGRLEIDSGFVERMIRKFAIGRNNWLFADTIAGAESSALLYSIVITMKVNGVNPYKALNYILEEIAKIEFLEESSDLLMRYEALADIIVAAKPCPD